MEDLKKSHFLSLYSMVLADGTIAVKELETLYKIGRENYQLKPEEINLYILSAGKTFIPPSSLEEKIKFLYELAQIAWADGRIDEIEKRLLTHYIIRLGFKDDNATEIAKYLLNAVQENKAVESILTEINSSNN